MRSGTNYFLIEPYKKDGNTVFLVNKSYIKHTGIVTKCDVILLL